MHDVHISQSLHHTWFYKNQEVCVLVLPVTTQVILHFVGHLPWNEKRAAEQKQGRKTPRFKCFVLQESSWIQKILFRMSSKAAFSIISKLFWHGPFLTMFAYPEDWMLRFLDQEWKNHRSMLFVIFFGTSSSGCVVCKFTNYKFWNPDDFFK